jgi:hypothetical protein
MKDRKYLVAGCSMLLAALGVLNCVFADDDPQIGDKPLSELLKQLRSENRGLQMRASQALSAAPTNLHARIIPQVIPVLRSERENDKFVAAQVLGVYGPVSRVAIPDLLPMLEGTQYERNRAAAAKALGQILKDAEPGDEVEKVTQALIKAFGDGYADVRREAVTACGMIGPAAKSSVKHLAPRLTDGGHSGGWWGKDEQCMVREAAAYCVMRMGPLAKEHTDLMISELHLEGQKDPVWFKALAAIGPVQGNIVPNMLNKIESKDNSGGRWVEAYEALGAFGPKAAEAVPLLDRFLRDRKVPTACAIQIIKTMGAIGPAAKEAVPTLEQYRKTKGYAGETTPEQLKEMNKAADAAIAAITGQPAAEAGK